MTPTGKRWMYEGGGDTAERRAEVLREMILEENSCGPGFCPCCVEGDIVRYGKTAKGTQRFRCKSCGQTFAPDGPLVGSQLTEEQWLRFAGCVARDMSAREAAEDCGVSIGTVYRMRRRLDEMIERNGGIRNTAFARVRPSKYRRGTGG